MTKQEKVIVEKAINNLLAEDGNFSGAIGSLCRLIGKKYAIDELYRSGQVESTSVADLSKEESLFRVK